MIFITILTIFFTLAQASRPYSDITIGQNETITYQSLTANDILGFHVSRAGDFNNDGFQDFIMTSQHALNRRGVVYLIFGSKNGLCDLTVSSGLSPNQGVMVYGANINDDLGYSVSYAGDVNGDKIDDIIVGSNQFQGGKGIAYILYGSKSPPAVIDLAQGLDPNQGFGVIGAAVTSFLGGSVSWAGDVNNDKIDDVIISAPSFSVVTGVVYVIFGKKGARNSIDLGSSGLSPSEGFMILGAASYDALGTSVAGGGDIDGDGIGDLIIAANGAYSGSGAVYVIYGKETFTTIDLSQGLSPLQGFMIKGGISGGQFGSSVAYAGDFNGDGHDDFLIGAIFENAYAGAVYVIFGGARSLLSGIDLRSGFDSTQGLKFKGVSVSAGLGFSVSLAGDINGDGIEDIIMGAPMENGGKGVAYVVFGSKKWSSVEIDLGNGLGPKEGFRIIGKNVGDTLGVSVGGVGDVNGDGMPDLLAGAYGVNAQAGAAYLWFSPLVCPENCLTCEKFLICLVCESGYGLENSKCIIQCPPSTKLENGVCIPKQPSTLETATEISKGMFDSSSTASRVFTMGRSLSVGLGLMAKIIQNVRYMNISYPPEVLNAFESYGTDLFELPIPEVFYESPETKDLPSQYSRYDINPAFLENYWQTIMSIFITLVCLLAIKLIQYLTRKQGKGHVLQIALKKVGQTAANFLIIQIYSNLDDVIFFFLLDASSTKMSSVSAGLSMGVGSLFLLLGLLLVGIHCWVLGKYQRAKQLDQLDSFREKFRFLGTLYEDFKDDNPMKQSFFGILILRSIFLVLVIMLLQPPWIQTSLLMIANLVFLGYFIHQRPFKSLFDEISQYFCEATIFTAYLSVLVLSVLDYKEDYTSGARNGFGKCIVISGIVLSLGGFIIQVIQIIGVVHGIYQFFKENSKRRRLRVPISIALRNHENQGRVLKSVSILKSQRSESSQIELQRNLTILEGMENSQPFGNELDSSSVNVTEHEQILNKSSRRRKIKRTRGKNKDEDLQAIEALQIKVLPGRSQGDPGGRNQMDGALKKRKKLRIKSSKFSDVFGSQQNA